MAIFRILVYYLFICIVNVNGQISGMQLFLGYSLFYLFVAPYKLEKQQLSPSERQRDMMHDV